MINPVTKLRNEYEHINKTLKQMQNDKRLIDSFTINYFETKLKKCLEFNILLYEFYIISEEIYNNINDDILKVVKQIVKTRVLLDN